MNKKWDEKADEILKTIYPTQGTEATRMALFKAGYIFNKGTILQKVKKYGIQKSEDLKRLETQRREDTYRALCRKKEFRKKERDRLVETLSKKEQENFFKNIGR